MTDLHFVDTNVLVYAMDPDQPEKRARAVEVLDGLAGRDSLVTSVQTLNECYRVLAERRRIVPIQAARAFILSLAWSCRAPLDWTTTARAWEISDRRGYSWWDCVMLASATQSSCALFISEDLQEGDDVDGMIVVNPFTSDIAQHLK